MFDELNKKLEALKVVPVVKLDREQDALPLGEALCAGGLPAAEITFRTDAAEGAIRAMVKRFPDMAVGAGTVTSVVQAKRAVDAGASFLVSPGVNMSVVEYCAENSVPIYPGTCTPSEIMSVFGLGIDVVKFFPCAQYGGLKTIKALAPVFPGLRFMPTGGINIENLAEFLAYDRIIACGGSWMVSAKLINAGRFDEITRLSAEAVSVAATYVK